MRSPTRRRCAATSQVTGPRSRRRGRLLERGRRLLHDPRAAGRLVRRYRVTRVVGSRFMQFYIGVQVDGPEPADQLALPRGAEAPLRLLVQAQAVAPRRATSTPVGPEIDSDGTPAFDPFETPRVHPWRAELHALPQHLPLRLPARLLAARALGLSRRATSQIAQPKLLPELLRAAIDLTADARGAPCGLRPARSRQLVTLGVSCESCHFGGARAREGRPAALGSRRRARSSRSCREDKPNDPAPSTQEPLHDRTRSAPSATAPTVPLFPERRRHLELARGRRPRRRARARAAIKCTDCHDPHKATAARGGPEGAAARRRVHAVPPELAKPGPAARHSRHPRPPRELPRLPHAADLTQGLEEVVRTHRISSPTDHVDARRRLGERVQPLPPRPLREVDARASSRRAGGKKIEPEADVGEGVRRAASTRPSGRRGSRGDDHVHAPRRDPGLRALAARQGRAPGAA